MQNIQSLLIEPSVLSLLRHSHSGLEITAQINLQLPPKKISTSCWYRNPESSDDEPPNAYSNLVHSSRDPDWNQFRAKRACTLFVSGLSSSGGDQTGAGRSGERACLLGLHGSPTVQQKNFIQHLTFITATKKVNLLIDHVTNARRTLWSSSEINESGESHFSFIINKNLSVCNKAVHQPSTSPLRKTVKNGYK